MMEFRICPDCGGYEMVSIPQEIDFYGTTDASQRPCTCRLKDEEKEMAEEYAECAEKIKFCPYCGTAIGIKGEE